MEVTAIYGESGTGKSTSALSYAHEHHIQAIIDDGLLIMNGKTIAGTSAKFEKNALTAVKRAIFMEEEHCQEVITAIQQHKLQSLLIIGTSKKMTLRIAERLQLPSIVDFVPIESIRNEAEILLAKYVREIHGKHTMPLPPHEVNQSFFQRVIQKGKDIFSSKKIKIGETTIVSPDFHHQTIFIHPKVYDDIITHIVSSNFAIKYVNKAHYELTEHEPIISVSVTLKSPVTYNVIEQITEIQKELQSVFMNMFQLKIERIQITIKQIQR